MSSAAPSLSPPRAATGAPAPDGRRRIRRGRPATPYLFVAPFLVLFIVFVVAPILALALVEHQGSGSCRFDSAVSVGVENYASLLSGHGVLSEEFWSGMRVTAIFTVLSVPLLVVVPFGLALLLNERFPGIDVLRGRGSFALYVLGVAVVGVLWGSCSMPGWVL